MVPHAAAAAGSLPWWACRCPQRRERKVWADSLPQLHGPPCMASTHFFRGPQQCTQGVTSESQGQFPLNRCFCHRSRLHSQFATWTMSAIFSPLSLSCPHWRSPEFPFPSWPSLQHLPKLLLALCCLSLDLSLLSTRRNTQLHLSQLPELSKLPSYQKHAQTLKLTHLTHAEALHEVFTYWPWRQGSGPPEASILMEFISQGHLQGACLEKVFHLLLILGLKRARGRNVHARTLTKYTHDYVLKYNPSISALFKRGWKEVFHLLYANTLNVLENHFTDNISHRNNIII